MASFRFGSMMHMPAGLPLISAMNAMSGSRMSFMSLAIFFTSSGSAGTMPHLPFQASL